MSYAPDYLADEDLGVIWVREDLVDDERAAVEAAVEWSEWELEDELEAEEEWLAGEEDEDAWSPCAEDVYGAVCYWRIDWDS